MAFRFPEASALFSIEVIVNRTPNSGLGSKEQTAGATGGTVVYVFKVSGQDFFHKKRAGQRLSAHAEQVHSAGVDVFLSTIDEAFFSRSFPTRLFLPFRR